MLKHGDKATRDVFVGTDSKDARSIPKQLGKAAFRTLDILNAAQDLMDLAAVPSNRLEGLKGNLAGHWSIGVNDQYRVIFTFADGIADHVRITDYHQEARHAAKEPATHPSGRGPG